MIDAVRVHDTSIPLGRTFRIARGATETLEAIYLVLRHGDTRGYGEATSSPSVTGETREEVEQALTGLDPEALDVDDIPGTLQAHSESPPAARAGLDLALHDLRGRLDRTPAADLLGVEAAERPTTATVSYADPPTARKEAEGWFSRGYVRLKVKLGDPETALATLDAVREVLPHSLPDRFPEPELWIDANESLTLDQALELLPELTQREVALLEQPLPREDLDGTSRLAEATELPIVLDEAIQRPLDVEELADLPPNVGVNVKVQKVGGLRAAMGCIEHARAQNRSVLVGCNIETGLGIAGGASLLGTVDRADLDGNLFLEHDPFPLPRPGPGFVGTPIGPGLGVHPDPRHAPPSLLDGE